MKSTILALAIVAIFGFAWIGFSIVSEGSLFRPVVVFISALFGVFIGHRHYPKIQKQFAESGSIGSFPLSKLQFELMMAFGISISVLLFVDL